jgi:hypothetical protein
MHVIRAGHLDLSFPRSLKRRDKFGYRLLLRKFKRYFFGNERSALTKKRCQDFFEDQSNFLERTPSIVPEPPTKNEESASTLEPFLR